MKSNLLLTKLRRPAVPLKYVPRPLLRQRLDRGLEAGHPLTLVSAPAGSGKTTCITEWLDSITLPVAWLTLDLADDEPGRFFTYLLAALQRIDHNLGQEIEAVLRAGRLPPGDIISARLINDILAIDSRFLLVLDDFQVIQDPFILSILQTLVANMPPSLHLMLLTREEPSLPLARLRANNQLTEIRAADLRFSHQETAAFLQEVMGLSLAPDEITALAGKTEGWIAGLQLAGLSMRDRPNPSAFITQLSGSHRHILRYLTEEVLQQQPSAIQEFLLQTAILDKLTGDLCDAVTGGTNGRSLLEQLFNDNLFLIPLDDEQQWYRYHQLFAGLLRDQQRMLRQEQTAVLHLRASRWYEQAGLSSEAIQHAIAAADYETAVALIETHAMDMLMAWHAKTVRGWMASIPPEWAAKSPRSNMAFAWMHLFSNNFAAAMPYIQRLQEIFAGDQLAGADPSVQAEWLAMQATLLNGQGMPEESIALANQALALVPDEDAYIRGLIYGALASSYKALNDYHQAVAAYEKLIQHGRQSGSLFSELMGISALGLYAMERGQLREGFEIAALGVERVERSGTLPPIAAAVYGELGSIYYHWYQLEQAHANFTRSTQVSSLSGYSDAEIFHHVIHSRLAQVDGDVQTAVREIEQAAGLMQIDAPAAIREEVIAQQVRVALLQNDSLAAEAALKPYGYSFQKPLSLPLIELDQVLDRAACLLVISALRLILHQGRNQGQEDQIDQGIELATRLIANAQNTHAIPVIIEALLIRAQMQAARGDQRSSQADAAAAVAMAEPEGFLTIFLEEGCPVAQILASLLENGLLTGAPRNHARKLFAAFPEVILAEPVSSPPAAMPVVLIEPLSARELEILQLISEGCTNQEIAKRLVITLHTVKKHSSNIYSKLGVRNRTQAVAKAREYQLL